MTMPVPIYLDNYCLQIIPMDVKVAADPWREFAIYIKPLDRGNYAKIDGKYAVRTRDGKLNTASTIYDNQNCTMFTYSQNKDCGDLISNIEGRVDLIIHKIDNAIYHFAEPSSEEALENLPLAHTPTTEKPAAKEVATETTTMTAIEHLRAAITILEEKQEEYDEKNNDLEVLLCDARDTADRNLRHYNNGAYSSIGADENSEAIDELSIELAGLSNAEDAISSLEEIISELGGE